MPQDKKQNNDTIVGLSSPPGNSLRAIVRLSGPSSLSILETLLPEDRTFDLQEKQFDWVNTQIHLDRDPPTILPCDVFIMKNPRTYTCEDIVELHMPGSIPLSEHLIETIQSRGARMAEPGEFTERAFLNGRIDITQAEAVLSIIEARNEEERKLALGQLEGKLSRKIQEVRDRLKHLCAYVESALDFADQDIEVINRDEILSFLSPLRERVHHILKNGKTQTSIREDPRVVIYGKPNAGKSSLFNTLIEEDRSIVTEIAGTTRDVIEGTLVGENHTIRLFDTAGVEQKTELSESEAPEDNLQTKMEEQVKSAIHKANLILHVVDGRTLHNDQQFPEPKLDIQEKKNCLHVVSKSDLLSPEQRRRLQKLTDRSEKGTPDAVTSSVTGNGMEELKEKLFDQTKEHSGKSGAFRLNIRHMNLLDEAEDHLERAETAVQNRLPYEFIASDLREGLNSLGKIVGDVGIEDILDTIFSEFCIGK